MYKFIIFVCFALSTLLFFSLMDRNYDRQIIKAQEAYITNLTALNVELKRKLNKQNKICNIQMEMINAQCDVNDTALYEAHEKKIEQMFNELGKD